MDVPPSREVRLQDGVTEGFAENVALKIYQGSAGELIEGITAIELTIESKRAGAARELAELLHVKLIKDGYLVASSIDKTLEDFLESEV